MMRVAPEQTHGIICWQRQPRLTMINCRINIQFFIETVIFTPKLASYSVWLLKFDNWIHTTDDDTDINRTSRAIKQLISNAILKVDVTASILSLHYFYFLFTQMKWLTQIFEIVGLIGSGDISHQLCRHGVF